MHTDRPTNRGVVQSFSWFQPRSRTIGVNCGAERISAKREVDSVYQKHGEWEDVRCWEDDACDVSVERDGWDQERERGGEVEEWRGDSCSSKREWRDEEKAGRGVSFGGLGNPVGKSFTTPTDPRIIEEPKAIHTQETEGESYLNRSVPTTSTLDLSFRHPFIDCVMGAQLSAMWKGLNMDCYDSTTDPDEHMDVYTTHMSLYTLDNAVMCRVFPTHLSCHAANVTSHLGKLYRHKHDRDSDSVPGSDRPTWPKAKLINDPILVNLLLLSPITEARAWDNILWVVR